MDHAGGKEHLADGDRIIIVQGQSAGDCLGGKKLLSISYDGLQSTHGFCLNNCVHTANLPDTPKDAIKYLYLTATNAAMEKGYIPFEDAQFGEYAKRHGEFDAFDLGFEKVNTVYSIDF